MSVEKDTAVTQKEARRAAVKKVRERLGTHPRVGEGKYSPESQQYKFNIRIRSPKLILDEDGENAVDVRYLQPIEIGKALVSAADREISVECPTKQQMNKQIREYEKELNQAIQKALVRATGSSLSHLPFPENQYAPVQDIISEVILNGEIDTDDLRMMDSFEESDKYQKYVDDLVELDLLNRRDNTLKSGDVLDTIQDKESFKGHDVKTYQDELDAALGLYFEHNVGELDMIKRTLGPYLAIAGYYYRRALELDDLPVIDEEELKHGIKIEYSGRQKQKKLFKLSRYLIQLENVGVIKSIHTRGKRKWVGNDDTYDNLRQSTEEMGPVSNLISPSVNNQRTLGQSD
jgi:hypothetical protein